jgi:hypothetical protein
MLYRPATATINKSAMVLIAVGWPITHNVIFCLLCDCITIDLFNNPRAWLLFSLYCILMPTAESSSLLTILLQLHLASVNYTTRLYSITKSLLSVDIKIDHCKLSTGPDTIMKPYNTFQISVTMVCCIVALFHCLTLYMYIFWYIHFFFSWMQGASW